MGDMLSQEEINELLNGGGASASSEPENTPEAADEQVPDLIELGAEGEETVQEEEDLSAQLTDLEKDTLGEVGNISMGAAATALHNLLDRRVNITTPVVTVTNQTMLAKQYDIPYVAIHVPYVEGLVGDNMLVIKTADVKAITSVLLGSDEYNDGTEELDELHLSAISEVMNQMMGASATAIAKLINKKINISTPVAETVRFQDENVTASFKDPQANLVSIMFEMDIENLFTTEIMLLMDIQFSKDIVNGFFGQEVAEPTVEPTVINDTPEPITTPTPVQEPVQQPAAEQPMQQPVQEPMYQQPVQQPVYQQPMQQPMYQQPAQQPMYQQPMQQPMYQQPMYQQPMQQPVNVQPVQFESFDEPVGPIDGENLQLLMDVPLQVSVELGRSKRDLKEILDFSVGSIVTLDRIVGDPVDVVVNGKLIAKGEVVVADDNFAVRIIDILKHKKR